LREGTKVKFTQLPAAAQAASGHRPSRRPESLTRMWFTPRQPEEPGVRHHGDARHRGAGAVLVPALQVDQFPNIDFPVVVVTAEYPGASPEIVESEVSKKIEEGVNSIAGINALTSRSYEGQSVVIMEFQLYVDGRKAAEDVREKIAAVRPNFRDEVKEPRVLRFDPASRAIWSVAVLPDASKGGAMSAVELTNWADQVLKKRLENVRGVGLRYAGGRHQARDQCLPESASHGVAGHHGRPGGQRRAQRKPGPAGGRDPLAGSRSESCKSMRA
jgi:predicted RNA-binding protein with TRAM domain